MKKEIKPMSVLELEEETSQASSLQPTFDIRKAEKLGYDSKFGVFNSFAALNFSLDSLKHLCIAKEDEDLFEDVIGKLKNYYALKMTAMCRREK